MHMGAGEILCSDKVRRLPIGKKPRIRIYSNGQMELVNSFPYWSDQFWWFCCEDYVRIRNEQNQLKDI